MRRLLPAILLSLGLHGLLSMITVEGPGTAPLPPPERILLSLVNQPAEKPSPPAVSEIVETPEKPPSPRLEPEEEKTPPPKKKTPRKVVKKRAPSIAPEQKAAPSATDPPGVPEREAPLTGTPQAPVFPSRTSLGEEAPGPAPVQARDAAPDYRRNPIPEYPLIARKRGYQGTVLLDVQVSREGRVLEMRVSGSSGYAVLDQAALRSVRTWLFDPGMRGGERVDMWVKVPVRFHLK